MINLITKYASKIQTAFRKQSLLTGRLSTEYTFTGVKTVKVIIPQTVPIGDYKREGTNRYGEPKEMEDVVQEMTLTQDKAFALTIDKGNNQEQGNLKNAGKMLALQIKDRAVPHSDKYGFFQLSRKAGKIVGDTAKITKANIIDRVFEATAYLDDNEIAESGRTLYISNTNYKLIKSSPEFIGNNDLGKAVLAKGQVGELDSMAVVKVPKSRMPANVNFIVVQKDCACFPVTLNESKLHDDPPGISGALIEGRQIYDLFVFHQRANGIYVDVDTSAGAGTICAVPTIDSASDTFTSDTAGCNFKYTTDGSDPRYSDSAVVGTSTDTFEVGTTVKVYAYKNDDTFPSTVAEYTIA